MLEGHNSRATWWTLCRLVTLAFRPQANGQIERVCKEIGRRLRHIVLDRRCQHRSSSACPSARPILQRVLNCQPHIALGVEPAKIVLEGAERYGPVRDACGTVCQGRSEDLTKRTRTNELSPRSVPPVVNDRLLCIAHLVDARRAVALAAREYQDSYLRTPQGEEGSDADR